MSARPSVCFVAPGHSLVSVAGSARNILATASALSKWVDVTVAFRNNAESFSSSEFEIVEIEPAPAGMAARDDVAARGLNPLAHLAYLKSLRKFSDGLTGKYDLVLEKGWRLSGYLCRELGKRGVPSMLIENDVRVWNEKIDSLRSLAKILAHAAAQRVAAKASRSAPIVVAETDELKDALLSCRGLQAEKVRVVPLGVDHSIFRPMNQDAIRHDLAIDKSSTVMLYVGGMDRYHDLSPLLRALRDCPRENLEIHLVGDGVFRHRYEQLSIDLSVPVRFHGQVDHQNIPRYIAAADVCVAPYDASGFYNNQVSFSTLKIPEYMACAKPVISIPSGHILSLIDNGVTGFLFDNASEAWRRFFNEMPDRQTLLKMGIAAAPAVASLTWSETARRYLQIGSEISKKSLYYAAETSNACHG